MAKTVKMNRKSGAGSSDKDNRLVQIRNKVEEAAGELADLLQEYDDSGMEEKQIDALTEALDALEDAHDSIDEVLQDEM